MALKKSNVVPRFSMALNLLPLRSSYLSWIGLIHWLLYMISSLVIFINMIILYIGATYHVSIIDIKSW